MDDGLAALIFIGGLIVGIPVGWFLSQLLTTSPPPSSSTPQSPASSPSSVHNKETWHWTDWQGKERSIEVDRVVD